MLDRLERGETVSLAEIESLPEIAEGREWVESFRDELVEKNPEFKGVPLNEVGTYLFTSPEREQLRNTVLQDRLKTGSFTGVDNNGKEVYNGSVEKGKRLDIVVGLPASGKSSAIVNSLSQYYKSVVVDSDIIKEMLPEFNEGRGATIVHEESAKINMRMLREEMRLGNNIVLPIVGAKMSSVERYLGIAKERGYDVHLHLNVLNRNKAMGRALGRYFEKKDLFRLKTLRDMATILPQYTKK